MTDTRTRYFYTDPLAAAWMARHHGMRFASIKSPRKDYTIGGLAAYCLPVKRPERFYIRDESLHLLDPKAGDLITYPSDGQGVYRSITPTPNKALPSDQQIIQRDGKPFFWPGREEV